MLPHSRLILRLLIFTAVSAGVMQVSAQQGNGAFSDQTSSSQINASFNTAMAGFLAGGVVGDFNNDGWQDVFYPAGGDGADKLYINNRDGTFSDQASAWNIALEHRSTAAAVGDYNRDGRLDIFVTSLGPIAGAEAGHHKLYRNNLNNTFTDVAVAAGVNQSSAQGPDGWGAAWGDYDLDGDLDLAVSGWNETNDGNKLFRNNSNGTFTDVTSSAGLGSLAGTNGFAPRFADMDGDQFPELIWIGDFTTGHYYANDGDGTFTDVTSSSNTNQDGTEMGMTVADWDEDGDFDFYVTTINSNNLYINQGGNVYQNQANPAGVNDTDWGWGTVAVDFNHDTLVDIIATAQNGRNFAFVNITDGGNLEFDEVAQSIGIGDAIDGRGISNFDYDNDGDQDIIVFPHAGSVKLFRNDLATPDTNWLRVFLDHSGINDIAPNGIGSVVTITLGSRTLIGRVDGGSNYLSQSELSAHFGLGAATIIDELRVDWSNGMQTVLANVSANQTITVAADPEVMLNDGFEG